MEINNNDTLHQFILTYEELEPPDWRRPIQPTGSSGMGTRWRAYSRRAYQAARMGASKAAHAVRNLTIRRTRFMGGETTNFEIIQLSKLDGRKR
jgi:hypothetical protein